MRVFSIALLMALNVFSIHAFGEVESYATGRAYYLDKRDQPAYREEYFNDGGGQQRVLYFSPGEVLIGRKLLDYHTGKTAPDFTFEDLRFSRILSAKHSDGGIRLTKEIEGKPESQTINVQKNQVIDAGFVAAIAENKNELAQGFEFNFAFADRLKNISLRAQSVNVESTPFAQGEPSYTYVKMALNNRFLAMFLDPIYLAFDQKMRLALYAGRSNLTNQNNEAFDVLIRYQYPD
ncbi:hypothetical protein [Gilvimarinus chinensis]|uniref:hypothetical protein n=1 Tax=Gilvimarinus chinensis TaxID=396005 RepID=UPI0003779288|nr:hypothetical protein [Gilvimarinus chinensis]